MLSKSLHLLIFIKEIVMRIGKLLQIISKSKPIIDKKGLMTFNVKANPDTVYKEVTYALSLTSPATTTFTADFGDARDVNDHSQFIVSSYASDGNPVLVNTEAWVSGNTQITLSGTSVENATILSRKSNEQ